MCKGVSEGDECLCSGTWRHLKKCFPHVKIGGFASCGFYAITEEKPRPRQQYVVDCFTGVLEWMSSDEHKAPLDFFSWHSYADIETTMIHADYCRRTLDRYGFADVETQLNEWNPSPRVFGLMQHAAYVGGMLCAFQNAPVDTACFYDARIGTSEYGSLFNPITRQPYADYDAFVMFGRLLQLGEQVALGEGVCGGVAGAGPGGGRGLVRKARQLAAVVVGADLVPGGADAVDRHRGADHPEFFLFNVFQDTKNHDGSICLFRAPVPFSGRDAP